MELLGNLAAFILISIIEAATLLSDHPSIL